MIHYSDRRAERLSDGLPCGVRFPYACHAYRQLYDTLLSDAGRAALLYLTAVQCFLFLYLRMSLTGGCAARSFLIFTHSCIQATIRRSLICRPLIRRRRSCRSYCQCSVVNTSVGNRPCRYYRSPAPKGRAGFIFNPPAAKSTRRFPHGRGNNPLIPLKSGVFEAYAQRPHKAGITVLFLQKLLKRGALI